jgi:hypothetical protein
MERNRPGPGAILGGIFLILVGSCIELAGATCAALGFFGLLDTGRSFLHFHVDPVAFLIFVVSLGVGLMGGYGIQEGVRIVRGKPRVARGGARGRAGDRTGQA